MKIRMTIKITNFLTQSAGQEMIVVTSLRLPVKRIYKEALSSKKGTVTARSVASAHPVLRIVSEWKSDDGFKCRGE